MARPLHAQAQKADGAATQAQGCVPPPPIATGAATRGDSPHAAALTLRRRRGRGRSVFKGTIGCAFDRKRDIACEIGRSPQAKRRRYRTRRPFRPTIISFVSAARFARAPPRGLGSGTFRPIRRLRGDLFGRGFRPVRGLLAIGALRAAQGDHPCARARLSRIPLVGSMACFPDSPLDRFDVERRLAHLPRQGIDFRRHVSRVLEPARARSNQISDHSIVGNTVNKLQHLRRNSILSARQLSAWPASPCATAASQVRTSALGRPRGDRIAGRSRDGVSRRRGSAGRPPATSCGARRPSPRRSSCAGASFPGPRSHSFPGRTSCRAR